MKGVVLSVGFNHFSTMLERGDGIIRRLVIGTMDD